MKIYVMSRKNGYGWELWSNGPVGDVPVGPRLIKAGICPIDYWCFFDTEAEAKRNAQAFQEYVDVPDDEKAKICTQRWRMLIRAKYGIGDRR
jgi:hypothetical protein